jgi:hypothetical protein
MTYLTFNDVIFLDYVIIQHLQQIYTSHNTLTYYLIQSAFHLYLQRSAWLCSIDCGVYIKQYIPLIYCLPVSKQIY